MLCCDSLRHAEYYDMQGLFDELYAKSQNGYVFTDLMTIILSRENILLAYRNIKTNTGSHTAGTDKKTIKDIQNFSADEVVNFVRKIICGKHGYRPKPVRRKDIPKPNGSTRPLGIPCIWDRLIQQCIKQVLEPICEAKFSNNSYGFRPNRSVEHAIARVYNLMQLTNLHYVVEFDIKGFFDNVNHSKLIKQIWALGIRDKTVIYLINQILKAPIKMQDGTLQTPEKGTPQGGIISPLLANIVLNELDKWVESQWINHPIATAHGRNRGNHIDKSNGYTIMKKTNLKEMYIVRYADDFRIFCRNRSDAQRAKFAITEWLLERLKLEISEEKTRIVNLKKQYSEFLGFKIKVRRKYDKYTVQSHMCDKALKKQEHNLTEQAKNVARPRRNKNEYEEIRLYNSMVLGVQNYYRIATHISQDTRVLNRRVMTIFTNRLHAGRGRRLKKHGRPLTQIEAKLYGKSGMLRYVKGVNEPIYPIGYVSHCRPINKLIEVCPYTPQGRIKIHSNLRINTNLLRQVMKQPLSNHSIEYTDNRISLFSAQYGRCYITGRYFRNIDEIHCHHKTSRANGGNDKYDNLVLVLQDVHILIHSKDDSTIIKYLKILDLTMEHIKKLNELRQMLNLKKIDMAK